MHSSRRKRVDAVVAMEMVRSPPSSSVCTVGAADAPVPIERDATENANFQRRRGRGGLGSPSVCSSFFAPSLAIVPREQEQYETKLVIFMCFWCFSFLLEMQKHSPPLLAPPRFFSLPFLLKQQFKARV